MYAITLALLASSFAGNDANTSTESTPSAIRMIDLNGDGLLDRLRLGTDGSVAIALNRGGRQFEDVLQELPAVAVVDVLVGDLDRDGKTDLYLVSSSANVALTGDGTGRFVDSTRETGLADAGLGRSAELVDVDADGIEDVLLHNENGDVLFWGGATSAFERDPSTPPVETARVVAGVTPASAAASAGEPGGDSSGKPDAAPGRERTSAGTRTVVVPESGPGGGGTEEAGGGISGTASLIPLPAACATTVRDVTSGMCVSADSTPTLGRLYPLGNEFYVSPLGRVGINNIVPAFELDVIGTARVSDDFDAGFGSTTDPSYRFSAAEFTGLSSPVSETLSLLTSATERIRIESDGDVGIGTSAPVADVHLVGDSAALGTMVISPNAGVNADSELFLTEDSTANLGFHLYYDGAALNQFQIQSDTGLGGVSRFGVNRDNGNVMVGTTDAFASSPAGPGLFRVNGTVSQSLTAGGLAKAGCHITGTGVTATVSRQFNNLPSGGTITVTRLLTGQYEVDFGQDLTGRFYQGTLGNSASLTPATGGISVTPRAGNANAVFVATYNTSGASIDNNFFIQIY